MADRSEPTQQSVRLHVSEEQTVAGSRAVYPKGHEALALSQVGLAVNRSEGRNLSKTNRTNRKLNKEKQ